MLVARSRFVGEWDCGRIEKEFGKKRKKAKERVLNKWEAVDGWQEKVQLTRDPFI